MLHFIRTTDPGHINAAQEFWKICDKNGFIYKKNYTTKYCPAASLKKTESDLWTAAQSIPRSDLILIDEENYFFKFSEFQKPLLDFYEKNPKFVVPDFRLQ
jgi:methionyl-tRNA synthetase